MGPRPRSRDSLLLCFDLGKEAISVHPFVKTFLTDKESRSIVNGLAQF